MYCVWCDAIVYLCQLWKTWDDRGAVEIYWDFIAFKVFFLLIIQFSTKTVTFLFNMKIRYMDSIELWNIIYKDNIMVIIIMNIATIITIIIMIKGTLDNMTRLFVGSLLDVATQSNACKESSTECWASKIYERWDRGGPLDLFIGLSFCLQRAIQSLPFQFCTLVNFIA